MTSGSSLRRRIAGRLALSTALVLVTAGLVLDRFVERRLARDFDFRLLSTARALATLTENEPERGYELEFADEVMPEFERRVDPDYFQVWVENGQLLERSRSLADGDLEQTPGSVWQPTFRDVRLPDGRSGRQVELDYAPQMAVEAGKRAALEARGSVVPLELRTATVVVATGRAPIDQTILKVRIAFAVTACGLLLALVILGLWAVDRGLAPVAAIGRQVESIDTERLDSRIDVPEAPAELAPFVSRLNDLFGRLEAAFVRERRFSSDAAHELRTPIAELRNLADVAGRWPEDQAVIRGYFEDVAAIAARMQGTIETLLALARSEAGVEAAHPAPVDVAELLGRTVDRWQARARERGLTLDVSAPMPAVETTDAEKLECILDNLIGNAVAYAPSGDTVRVALQPAASGSVVSVENRAPELDEADLEFVFDRFWRKDVARSDGHSGLGLALAAALANLLGISLSASFVAAKQVRFELSFRRDQTPGFEGAAAGTRSSPATSRPASSPRMRLGGVPQGGNP